MHKEFIYLIYSVIIQLENGRIRLLTQNLMFYILLQASKKHCRSESSDHPHMSVQMCITEWLESFTKHQNVFLCQRIPLYKSSLIYVGSLKG